MVNVRKVYDELTGRKDDLSDWVGARRFFLDEGRPGGAELRGRLRMGLRQQLPPERYHKRQPPPTSKWDSRRRSTAPCIPSLR